METSGAQAVVLGPICSRVAEATFLISLCIQIEVGQPVTVTPSLSPPQIFFGARACWTTASP